MPVQFLGRLGPTRKQQTALQRSLGRVPTRGAAPRGVSALSRGLGGPSYAETHQPKDVTKKTDWVAVAERRREEQERALATQIRAAQPTAGQAALRERTAGLRERLAETKIEEETKLDKEADALYGFVQDISEEDQNFILSQITKKGKPSALGAALEEGAPTPVGRTDPLMQIMIDKHYIRLDEKGEYSWMLPVEEKEVINVSTWTDESGWLQQTTTYDDGTTETTNLGREAKEVADTGLSPTEQLNILKFQFGMEESDKKYAAQAVKDAGGLLVEGEMVRRPGEDNWKAAGPDDVERQAQKVRDRIDYLRVETEGINSKADAKIRYQYDTEAIKYFQRAAGMVADGKWSPALEQWIQDNVVGED